MTPDRYLLPSFIGMSVGFWLALLSGSIFFGVVGGYFAALVVMKLAPNTIGAASDG